MTIRFYLPRSASADFIKSERHNDMYRGHQVHDENGLKFIQIDQEIELVQDDFLPHAEKISIRCSHRYYYPKGRRSPGQYKLGDASLILEEKKDATRGGGQYETLDHSWQSMACDGSSLENVKGLIIRVKAGTIRPRVSYDAEQVRPLQLEFYDWLVAGIRLLKRDVLRFKTVI